MRGAINGLVIRVVDPLDDVALLANPGIGENREGRREIFQVRLERADVDRGSVRNVLPKAKGSGNPLCVISPANSPTRTLMVLRDWISPYETGLTPPYRPSEFPGDQLPAP